MDCDGIVNLAKRIGLPDMFGTLQSSPVSKDPAVMEDLMKRYRGDIDELEQLLGRDLSLWRKLKR
jgi:hypothetical protein